MKTLLKVLLVLVLLIGLVLFLAYDSDQVPTVTAGVTESADTLLLEEMTRIAATASSIDQSLDQTEVAFNEMVFANLTYGFSPYDPNCSDPECSYWLQFGGFSDIPVGITGVWSDFEPNSVTLYATVRSDYYVAYQTKLEVSFDVVETPTEVRLQVSGMKLGKLPVPNAFVTKVANPILGMGNEDLTSAPGIDMNTDELLITIDKTTMNTEFSIPSYADQLLEEYYPAYIMMMWLALDQA